MKVSILLPTLGTREMELKRLFDSLESQTNNSFEIIIVSQGNHKKIEELLSKYKFKYNQIKINKIGLSIARNIGLKYISGDYLILSDDDAWYPKDAIDKIIRNIEASNSEILCFRIFDPISNKFYKNYKKHAERVSIIQILKKSSIEIIFNIKKIDKNKIIFNENFGLGTKYPSGEENLLLNEMLKCGYRISFINETIVYHEKKKSYNIDSNYIRTKCEIGKRIYGKKSAYIYVSLLLLKNLKNIEKISKFKAFKMVSKFTILE